MTRQIEAWGGDRNRLWESVKGAERREGVVYRVVVDPTTGSERTEAVVPSRNQNQRELERLHASLSKIVDRREVLAREQEVLGWRERVVELAAGRAERKGECGWDQRLCFGDEEVLEFGGDVEGTYDEDERRDGMVVEGQEDGADVAGEGEWWCGGKKKCDRHAGYALYPSLRLRCLTHRMVIGGRRCARQNSISSASCRTHNWSG